MRFKIAPFLLILSLAFAVLSMQFSGALSQGRLNRAASAPVVKDNTALLKLDGFQNKSYNMNNKYASFGSITNNTNQTMKLTVTITPGFTNNKNSNFNIKLGTETVQFKYKSASPKQVLLTLAPGQSVDAQASMNNNPDTVTASFQFLAVSSIGSYSAFLGDTAASPRRITLY